MISTLTNSERKAFEAVLKFTPDEISQADVEKPSGLTDAHDVDIENILEIFTASVQSDEPQQDASELNSLRDEQGEPYPWTPYLLRRLPLVLRYIQGSPFYHC